MVDCEEGVQNEFDLYDETIGIFLHHTTSHTSIPKPPSTVTLELFINTHVMTKEEGALNYKKEVEK